MAPAAEVLRRLEALETAAAERAVSLPAHLDKELEMLRTGRLFSSDHAPPSAWARREDRYRQDLEKFERTVSRQRARISALEAEVAELRAGASIAPLEQRIAELEERLRAEAKEKVQLQSRFHELSIRHRQLLETTPKINALWREVLVEQHHPQGLPSQQHGPLLPPSPPQQPQQQQGQVEEHSNSMLPPVPSPSAEAASHAAAAGPRVSSLAANFAGALPPLRTDWGSPEAAPHGFDLRDAPGVYSHALIGDGGNSSSSGSSSTSSSTSPAGSVGAPQPGTPPPEGEPTLILRAESATPSEPLAPSGGDAAAQASGELVAAAGGSDVAVNPRGAAAPEAHAHALAQLNHDLSAQLEVYQGMVASLKHWMAEVGGGGSLEAGPRRFAVQDHRLHVLAALRSSLLHAQHRACIPWPLTVADCHPPQNRPTLRKPLSSPTSIGWRPNSLAPAAARLLPPLAPPTLLPTRLPPAPLRCCLAAGAAACCRGPVGAAPTPASRATRSARCRAARRAATSPQPTTGWSPAAPALPRR
jgi:cell division protein FtsL